MIHSIACLLALGAAANATPQDSAAIAPAVESAWTILVYGAADNSCERTFLPDVAKMKEGLAAGQSVELVLFVDRGEGYSADDTTLGEDFLDSRLYRIADGAAERLDGAPEFPEITRTSRFEANQGDADNVRKLIRFGKAHFPARRYALFFYSHGDGRAMCPDDGSGGDELFPAELSATLGEADSVDLLVFDVCSMGGVENAYQWRAEPGRFGARAMVASASVSGPLPYREILGRLRKSSARASDDFGDGDCVDPSKLDALGFGRLVLEEIEAQRRTIEGEHPGAVSYESWACYDLARAGDLKRELDLLARELALANAKDVAEELRGSDGGALAMNYMVDGESCWSSMPYFDLYELARRLEADERLDPRARKQAARVMQATDELVLVSFGLKNYRGFRAGKNGVYVLFPDGDASEAFAPQWKRFAWYQPSDANATPHAYGRLAWCADGAVAGDGKVETWYELLESWFDAKGECNAYSW